MKRTGLRMGLLALAAAAGMVPALGAGVVVTPGAKTEFTVPLDAAGIAELADNGGVVEARVGLWVPSDFDPAREWYVLLVSSTADGGALSVSAMDAFLPAAQSAGGWIVMAADGTARPVYDDDPYRWAVMRAGLQALAERWPAAREWPVAAGGFSGGAKFSGLMGGQLYKNGYTLVGMWMGGCNEDMASAAVRTYAPGVGFLDVPVFLSSGRADTIATPADVAWVRRSMEETGFSNVRLDSHPGGHTLYAPHAEDGLRWFVNMDGRGRTTATLDPQGGEGGNRKVDVVAGQPLPAVAPPERAGHAFTGYYSAAAGAGTQYYAADGTGVHVWDLEAGTVLYAAWAPLTYTLTLDPQGGTGGTDRVQAEYGAIPPPIAVPTYADHAFGGYFGAQNGQGTQYYDADGTGATSWDVAADTTLYAYWKWTGGGDVAWEYRVEDGHAVVTGASPAIGRLEIPAALDGFPVAAIGEEAFFRETGLTEVVLPEGLTAIGDFAFNQCRGLVAVSFPDSLEEIGYLAFNLCSALEAATLGDRVRRIGGGAFRECDSLVSVAIPAGVEDLGSGSNWGVFESCDSLQRIVVASGNGAYASRGGVLFTKDGTTLLQYPGGKAGDYAIPDGVRRIASSAFSGCRGLGAVTGGRDLESIGHYAFESCWNLVSVPIPEHVSEIGDYAFSACYALGGVDIPASVVRIGDYAFEDCRALRRVDLPGNLRELGFGAFEGCSSLLAVSLPPGLASIRGHTFYGCTNLPSLAIPASVTDVGIFALYDCNGLDRLYLPEAWQGTTMLADAQVPVESRWEYGELETVVADGAEWRYVRTSDRAVLVGGPAEGHVAIPDTLGGLPVAVIAGGAFACRTGLLGITIPDGVEEIGPWAFYGCQGLAEAAIPGNVAVIGREAFAWCTGLVDLAIGNGVAIIGDRAFSDCWVLTSLRLPGSVVRLGRDVFADCLETLYVPASWKLTDILDNAGVPEGCTVVYGAAPEEGVTATGVPHAWLEENAADILAANGGNPEAAAKAPAANGLPVWECYVAGLSPTDPAAAFKVKSITVADGKPVIEWEPDLGEDRAYVVEGKAAMADEWGPRDATSRFFRVKVLQASAPASRTGVQLWAGGPYWAETNIGAQKPWEYGFYFWWGDTVGYKRAGNIWVASDGSAVNYSFDSENMPNFNSADSLQSAGWIDASGNLMPEYDAAQVHWGGGWRMPTDSELSALVNNCDWTWTATNGMNGYVVHGKGDFGEASIFLPAAGSGAGTSLDDAGSYGFFWSSTPDTNSWNGSWDLVFLSERHLVNANARVFGFSVRPVRGATE